MLYIWRGGGGMASDLSSNEMFEDEKEEGEISLDDVSSSEEMATYNRHPSRILKQCSHCHTMGVCASWCGNQTYNKNHMRDVAGKENRHFAHYRLKDDAPGTITNNSNLIKYDDGLQSISSNSDDFDLELVLLEKKLAETKSKLRKINKKKRKRSPSLSLSPPPTLDNIETSIKGSINRKDNNTTVFSRDKHRSGHRRSPDRRSPPRRHTKKRLRSRSPISKKKSPFRLKKAPKRLSPVNVVEPAVKSEQLEESPSSRGTVTKLLKKVRKLEPFSSRTKEQGSSLKDKLSNIIKIKDKTKVVEEKEMSKNYACDKTKSEIPKKKDVTKDNSVDAKPYIKEENEVEVTKVVPKECEIVKQVIKIPDDTVFIYDKQEQKVEPTEKNKKESILVPNKPTALETEDVKLNGEKCNKNESNKNVKSIKSPKPLKNVEAIETIETIESIEPVEESSGQKLSAFHMDDNDEDLELRMIALRSAVIKKHHSRVQGGRLKKKQKSTGMIPRIESPFTSNFVEEFPLLAEICSQDSPKNDLYDIEDMELDSDMENDDDAPYSPSDDISQFLMDNEELQEYEQSLFTSSKPMEISLKEGTILNKELDGNIFETRPYSPSDDTIYDPDLSGVLSINKPTASSVNTVTTSAPPLQPPPLPPLSIFSPQPMLVSNLFNPFNNFSALNPLATPFHPYSAADNSVNHSSSVIKIDPVLPSVTINNVNQFSNHKIDIANSINQLNSRSPLANINRQMDISPVININRQMDISPVSNITDISRMNVSPISNINSICQMNISPIPKVDNLHQFNTIPGNININQTNNSLSANINNKHQFNSAGANNQFDVSTIKNNENLMNILNESADDLGYTDLDGSPLVSMDQPQSRLWTQVNGEPLYLRDFPNATHSQQNKLPQFLEPSFVPLSVMRQNKHLRKLIPHNNNSSSMFKTADMMPVQVEKNTTAIFKPIKFTAMPHRNFTAPAEVFNSSVEEIIEPIKNSTVKAQEEKKERREKLPLRNYKRESSVTLSSRRSRRKSVTPMRIIKKDGERKYEFRSQMLKDRNSRDSERTARRKSSESRKSPREDFRREKKSEEKKRRLSIDSNVDDDEQVLREKLLASLAKRNKLTKVQNATSIDAKVTSGAEKRDTNVDKTDTEKIEEDVNKINQENSTTNKDISVDEKSKDDLVNNGKNGIENSLSADITAVSHSPETDSTIVVTINQLEKIPSSSSQSDQPIRKVARKLNVIPASTRVVNNAKRFQNLLLQRRLAQQKISLLASKSRFKINNKLINKNTHSSSTSSQVKDTQKFIIRLNEDSETESESDEPETKINSKTEITIPITTPFEKSVENFLKNIRQQHETTTSVTSNTTSKINTAKASIPATTTTSSITDSMKSSIIAETVAVTNVVETVEPIPSTISSVIDSVKNIIPVTAEKSSEVDSKKTTKALATSSINSTTVTASSETVETKPETSCTASSTVHSKEIAAIADSTKTTELTATVTSTETISTKAITPTIITSLTRSTKIIVPSITNPIASTTSVTNTNNLTTKTVIPTAIKTTEVTKATAETYSAAAKTVVASTSLAKEKITVNLLKTVTADDPLLKLRATPQAVKHLPASRQEEYRRLKQQLIEREKLRLQRLKDAAKTAKQQTSELVNTVNSASSPISSTIVSSTSPPTTVTSATLTTSNPPLAKIPEPKMQLVATIIPMSRISSIETSTTTNAPTENVKLTKVKDSPTKADIGTSIAKTAVTSTITSNPKSVTSSTPKVIVTSSFKTVTPSLKTIATTTLTSTITTNTASSTSSISALSTSHAALLDKMNAALLSQRAQINSVVQKVSTLRILKNNQVNRKTLQAQSSALKVLTKEQINQKMRQTQHTPLKVLTRDQINQKPLLSQGASLRILMKDQVNQKLQVRGSPVSNIINKTYKKIQAPPKKFKETKIITEVKVDSTNAKKAKNTEQISNAAKQPWEEFRQTVNDEVNSLTNLSAEEHKKILIETEEKLIVKRHSVLDDVTEMSNSLSQWEKERDKQSLLKVEIVKLREQLRIAEEKLNIQKEKLQTIQPKVQFYHEKINIGRKECFRLSKICNGLGQQIVGPNYIVPTAGAEHLNNRIKEVANHTQKLRGMKAQTRLNAPAKTEKTKNFSTINKNTNTIIKNLTSGDKRADASVPAIVNSESRVNSVNNGAKIKNCVTNSNVNVKSVREENAMVETSAASSNVSMSIVNSETEVPLAESTLKSESNIHIKIEDSSTYGCILNSVSNNNKNSFNPDKSNLLNSYNVVTKRENPDEDSAINSSTDSMSDPINNNYSTNHGVHDLINKFETESEKQSGQCKAEKIDLDDNMITGNDSGVSDGISLITKVNDINSNQMDVSIEINAENSFGQNLEFANDEQKMGYNNAESVKESIEIENVKSQTKVIKEESSEYPNKDENTQKLIIQESDQISQETHLISTEPLQEINIKNEELIGPELSQSNMNADCILEKNLPKTRSVETSEEKIGEPNSDSSTEARVVAGSTQIEITNPENTGSNTQIERMEEESCQSVRTLENKSMEIDELSTSSPQNKHVCHTNELVNSTQSEEVNFDHESMNMETEYSEIANSNEHSTLLEEISLLELANQTEVPDKICYNNLNQMEEKMLSPRAESEMEEKEPITEDLMNPKSRVRPYESILKHLQTPRNIKPDGILCPYELMGTCHDADCQFVHQSTSQ